MAFQYELFNVLRADFHLPKVQMTVIILGIKEDLEKQYGASYDK